MESMTSDTLHMNSASASRMTSEASENVKKFLLSSHGGCGCDGKPLRGGCGDSKPMYGGCGDSKPMFGGDIAGDIEYVKGSVKSLLKFISNQTYDTVVDGIKALKAEKSEAFIKYFSEQDPATGMSGIQYVHSVGKEFGDRLVGELIELGIPKVGRFNDKYELISDGSVTAAASEKRAEQVKQLTSETSTAQVASLNNNLSATSPANLQQIAPATKSKGIVQSIVDIASDQYSKAKKFVGLQGGEGVDNASSNYDTDMLISKVINGSMNGGTQMVSGTRHPKRYFDYSISSVSSGGAKKHSKKHSKKHASVYDMGRAVNDVHIETVSMIKELMKCDDETAETYKSVLYRRVKAENPELPPMDRANKMKSLATKDVLKKIDIDVEKQKRQQERSEHESQKSSESSDDKKKGDKKTSTPSDKKTKKTSKKSTDSSDSSDGLSLSL